MKNLLPLVYLTVASCFLISCEKEVVEPTLSAVSASEGRAIACTNYSYSNKLSEVVDLGPANGDLVLLGFSEGMSLQARQQVLY